MSGSDVLQTFEENKVSLKFIELPFRSASEKWCFHLFVQIAIVSINFFFGSLDEH